MTTMTTSAQQILHTPAQRRATAAALALLLTLAMLLGVDHLASSDAPASLIAQVTSARG